MRKKFSERIGIVDSTPVIQTDGMNVALRNTLWNFIYSQYEGRYQDDYWKGFARLIASSFRKFPIDELPSEDYMCRKWVKEYFYSLDWYDVYDFVEFIVENCAKTKRNYDYTYSVNQLQKLLIKIFGRYPNGRIFLLKI